MAPPSACDSAAWPGLRGFLAFLQRHSLPRSPPLCPLGCVSSGLHPAFQSLCSSSQPLNVPGDLSPCPGCVGLRHGLSVWFSLHSECHRPAASCSDSVKCCPSVPNNFPDMGILPPLQFPQPPGAGPVSLTLLFFSSFLHPTKFCMDLYIPIQWSGTPACCQLVFCENFCI